MKRSLPLVLLTLMSLIIIGQAQAKPAGVIALALKVKGEAKLTRGQTTTALKFGKTLLHGDIIDTGEDGFVTIMFTDDRSLAKLEPNTHATIEGKRTPDGAIAKRISLDIGNLFVKIQNQRGTFEVATPTSVASVKGTIFYIVVGSDGTTYVVTLEGLISLLNRITGQVIEIQIGQRGEVDPDGNMNVEEVEDEDLPVDPDPDPVDQGPMKTIEIEYLDLDGERRTITIQYRENEQE